MMMRGDSLFQKIWGVRYFCAIISLSAQDQATAYCSLPIIFFPAPPSCHLLKCLSPKIMHLPFLALPDLEGRLKGHIFCKNFLLTNSLLSLPKTQCLLFVFALSSSHHFLPITL
jgi:hypothetical protein